MNMHQYTIPWYKQPLVWMLVAIPMSAVVMGVIVMYLAITTDDGLVAENYYKKGMTINRQLAREDTAKNLQLTAVIDITIDTGYIRAVFNKGQMAEYPSQLQLALKHATKQQNDVYAVLQKGMENNYVGSMPQGVHLGIWHIELNNSDDETVAQWRLSQRVRLESETSISLQAE